MADPSETPFFTLRAPVDAVAPDRAFADRLRARLERALSLPKGVAVTTATTTATTTAAATADVGAAVPYLAVRDARAAIEWYADVYGARQRGQSIEMPDGRIGHAELELGGGVLYLADEHPEIGVTVPQRGAASVSLVLAVDDVPARAQAAVAAGGHLTREPYDAHGHRNATVVDPFGHRWMLQAPLTPYAGEPVRHGDVVFTSLQVPDAGRAAAFYEHVLDWHAEQAGSAQRLRVPDANVSLGITGGQAQPALFCAYAVDDLDRAVSAVRAAGGRAGATTHAPHGDVADCTDDQGVAFALWQIGTGDEPPRPRTANGRMPGDLAYLTWEVRDSRRTRAFYATVLGWRFAPGHVADGWQVEGIAPMGGFSGGHDTATCLPMWRVDDIDSAVAAVRRAGGVAEPPSQQPYGRTAQCRDDQGMRFSLGQL